MTTLRNPSPEELLVYLLTWLGASGGATLLAAWGLWDAWRDWWLTHRVPKGIQYDRLLWQARNNLLLSVTFLVQALMYLSIGVLVVLGPAKINLEGPYGFIIDIPALFVIAQVFILRINRIKQKQLHHRETRERAEYARTHGVP
jgi:hypothetical protein